MFPKYKGDYYGSFVYDEAKELVKKGCEVHVITQHNEGIPYEENMDGIYIHRFRWLKPKKFRALVHFNGIKDYLRLTTYLISLFLKLINIIRKNNIDVIHSHSAVPTGFVSIFVSKILRRPHFITVHGMDVNDCIKHPIIKYFVLFALNNCDTVIVVSDHLKKKLISTGIYRKKIKILRNAINLNRFKPIRNYEIRERYKITNQEILILFVGYLDTFKGVFELVEAFHKLNNKYFNLKLMFVGVGPKSSDLINKTAKLGLQDKILFVGNISHEYIHEYYQAADIVVLPSYGEGGGPPLSILEAMACGIPVIGSNVGGIPEGIHHSVNGLITSPKNINDLAKKIEILVTNHDLRKQFGKESLRIIKIKSLDINTKINKLVKFYKNSIG